MLKLIIFINLVFEKNKLLRIVRSSLIELPSSILIRYTYKFLPLVIISLVLQIARGLLLALSYNCDIGTAFFRVDAIMRELPRCGWLFRSIHSNGAIIFFVFIYLHIARGLYYRSFNFSYILLIERSILLLIIGAAFLGYVLFWDQIRFWGALLPFILIGIRGLYLFFLRLRGLINSSTDWDSSTVWKIKKPCKQIFIKLEFFGDSSDTIIRVKELEKIIKIKLCKNIDSNKYRLIIRKNELIHRSELLSIYWFNILLSFDRASDRPLRYYYENYLNWVFNELKVDYDWSRRGVKRFNSRFYTILDFLPKNELQDLYAQAADTNNGNTSYKSKFILINKKGFNRKLILGHKNKNLTR